MTALEIGGGVLALGGLVGGLYALLHTPSGTSPGATPSATAMSDTSNENARPDQIAEMTALWQKAGLDSGDISMASGRLSHFSQYQVDEMLQNVRSGPPTPQQMAEWKESMKNKDPDDIEMFTFSAMTDSGSKLAAVLTSEKSGKLSELKKIMSASNGTPASSSGRAARAMAFAGALPTRWFR